MRHRHAIAPRRSHMYSKERVTAAEPAKKRFKLAIEGVAAMAWGTGQADYFYATDTPSPRRTGE